MSAQRFDRRSTGLWRLIAVVALVSLAVREPAPAQDPPPDSSRPKTENVDLILRGGRVMDGAGSPAVEADVAVHRGRIHTVGDVSRLTAAREIDVSRKIVAPGFIDLHSHADGGLSSSNEEIRAAGNLVSQGIVTVVVNQDGGHRGSIARQKQGYETHGIGPNAILLVGHNTIRRQVLRDDCRRTATADQIDQMRRLVRAEMESGAYGLSAGLEYVPGIWSTTDEVVALVEEIVPFGGVCIVHERASGADPMWFLPSQHSVVPPDALDTVRELVEIAERTGATVVATHIKARGVGFWGSSPTMIRMIEAARKRGLRLYADQYPYNTTGSDGRLVLVPSWVRKRVADERRQRGEKGKRNYGEELAAVLEDPALRADIERDISHEIKRRGGAENIVIMECRNASLVGLTLAQTAHEFDVSPVQMALRLQQIGDPYRPGGARLRGYSLSELDVENFAARPWTATSTDAGITMPGRGDVHARFYGTYPRKIRRYAIDRGVLSVEAAVRSATSLPAEILGLADRGQVREGFRADLVVFDLDRIRDKATFEDPHQYCEGVEYVFVGGISVVDHGKLTGALPGKVISPPAADNRQ